MKPRLTMLMFLVGTLAAVLQAQPNQLDPTFFETVNYRGAFDPTLSMNQQWTAGWTNFDPQNTAYSTTTTAVIGAGEGAAYKQPYHQVGGTTVTLSSDTTYILTGFYYVDSLATLVIEPGTVVLGDSLTAGTLIVKRGGKVIAQGSPTLPIVFTSRQPIGQRVRGDWGGIILLGSAPVNKVDPIIEGGVDGTYGGANEDDSSGVLSYVRVEFPGIVFSINNEINGITMGGVGRKTKLDHLQVSYSNDDSYEWFGGSVDAKYLVAFAGTDDEFDTDFGYHGRVQFAYGVRDPFIWDAAGQSNGFESDNDDPATFNTPRTSPVFSNVTLVGPQSDTTVSLPIGQKFERSALLRRNTLCSIHNSILMGYPFGLEIRNDGSAQGALNDSLQVRNVSLQARTNIVTKQSSSVTITFDPVAWFNTPAYANTGSSARQPQDLVGANYQNWFFSSNPQPIPVQGQGDPSLFVTDFPTGVALYNNSVPESFELAQNFPNPFNPATTIRYALPAGSQVSLVVYNLLGQEVQTLVSEFQNAGTYTLSFDASQLSSGTYLYRLSTGSHSEIRKMVLMK